MKTIRHTISYCYPGSPRAKSLGRTKTGCYWVCIDDVDAGRTIHSEDFPTYAEALQCARRKGGAPTRWSIDHPCNADFLAKGSFQG